MSGAPGQIAPLAVVEELKVDPVSVIILLQNLVVMTVQEMDHLT